MIRSVFTVLLMAFALNMQASSDACRIIGTAYEYTGRPLPAAVVRLIDLQSHRTTYRAADASATFAFDGLSTDASGQRYRLDVLSPEVVVTGTHIRTRSILGIAPTFICEAGQSTRVDVRVAVPE